MISNKMRWTVAVLSAILTFMAGVLGAVLNLKYEMNFPDLGSVFAITLIGGIIIFNIKK